MCVRESLPVNQLSSIVVCYRHQVVLRVAGCCLTRQTIGLMDVTMLAQFAQSLVGAGGTLGRSVVEAGARHIVEAVDKKLTAGGYVCVCVYMVQGAGACFVCVHACAHFLAQSLGVPQPSEC